MNDDQQWVADYITRRYGPSANRSWWGIAHRRWLVNSGQYVKTSDLDQEWIDLAMDVTRKIHARWVGEDGPELVRFRRFDQ